MIEYEFEKKQRAEIQRIRSEGAALRAEIAIAQAAEDVKNEERKQRALEKSMEFFQDGA